MNVPLAIAWIVAFVIVSVTVAGASRRLGWSAPVLLVAVGSALSFVPGVPEVEVEPEAILYGVLPPLLFATAIRTSVIEVRARRDAILILSVALVVVTVLVVGAVGSLLLPAVGIAAAFALAAVIAPTDAIAVTAVAGRVAVPRRVVTVLEGESLLNDATALVLLNTAIAAIATTVDPLVVGVDLALAVIGGLGVGFGVGWATAALRARLRSSVLDTSLALITPYFAFIAAEAVLGSGVLAVVIAALYLGFRSPAVQSAQARIAEAVNWRTVRFLLENAVFLFIGLNAAGIIGAAVESSPGFWPTVLIVAGLVGALVVARFGFVFAMVWVFRHGPRAWRQQELLWRNAVVVAAANVRGVVTLAAVFLLPPETPDREFLQFLTFVVVVVTLVGGLALPRLVRMLRLTPPDRAEEHVEWQRLMAEAREAGVRRLDAESTDDDEERVIAQLRSNASLIADSLEEAQRPPDSETLLTAYNRLRTAMIGAERDAVLLARAERRYSEPAVRAALRAIDLEELALRTTPPDPNAGTPGGGGKEPR